MKKVQLNNGTIELPEDWMELTEAQRVAGFENLALVLAKLMTPFEWQCRMLLVITGYKPSRTQFSQDERDRINENLVRLAEMLNFAFTIEEDENGKGILHINYEMHDCPVHIFGDTGVQPLFVRDRIIDTNLTAGIYSDAYELLQMVNDKDNSPEDTHYYMLKLAQTLWRVDSQSTAAPEPCAGELLAVTVWFTGIVLFFQEHAIYGVLYEGGDQEKKAEDHISLGIQDTILELTMAGHPDARSMPLTEFFDMQVKMLKDRILEAKAEGTSVSDIAKKSKMPLATILRLI